MWPPMANVNNRKKQTYMKFNVQSKLLLSHLSAVSKVVNSKNTISILDNFLFSLEDGRLVVTGSDQETTITTSVPVTESEGIGKFAVNVRSILELLKQLPDLGLEFEIDDDNLAILVRYQNGKYNFIGIDGNEFPQKAPMEPDAQTFTVPAAKFVSGVQHAIFAVGEDTLRPVMMGVYCDITPDSIAYVASDTHVLVRYIQRNVATGITASFILPSKPASILSSVLDKKDGDLKVTFDSKSAVFVSDEYTLSCRFVNGRYPNYNSVIPTDSPFTASVDRAQLLNALRRVSVFASSGGQVTLELTADQIHLSAQNVDFSTSADEHLSCSYDGTDMVISFNGDNIIDVLNNIPGDTVLIKLIDPARAGLFVPAEQPDGEDLLVLLMPMMV